MARKQHLRRLAAPQTWPIERKKSKWIAKPLPGTHNLMSAMPLVVVIREILKIVDTSKDVKQILNQSQIKINNKIIRKPGFSVGLFDTISIDLINKNYRMTLSEKGKLKLIEIPAKEVNIIPLKIVSKITVKKNRLQINLNNGWNILTDNKDLKVRDLLLLDSKKKIIKHIPFKKGNIAFITGGTHSGKVAKFDDYEEVGILRKRKIATISIDKEKLRTPLDNIFIIGEKNPEVKINE